MSEYMLTVETASRRPSRQLSSISVRGSPLTDRRGSVSTDRRPSLFSFGRHKKSVRPKPRLDEAALRAKQEWAAKGLLMIMRKKVAERRRIAFGETAPGTGDEFRNRDEVPYKETELETEINRDKSAQQTMINGYIISAIPYMPKSMAALCFILNVLIPGSGTIMSGLSVFCCGTSRMPAKDDQHGTTCCVNLMVGMMQLFTVTFLLVGWVWSLVWGIYMIILADEMQKQQKEKRQKELQAKALVAMNNKLRAWTMVGRNK